MANYTFRLADVGAPVGLSTAEAISVLVPSDAAVQLPVGSVLQVDQLGAGTISLIAGSGVTINGSPLVTSGQYTSLFLRKTAPNTFSVVTEAGGVSGTALVADSGSNAALLAGGAAIPGRGTDTAAFNHRLRLPFNAGLTQLRRDGTTTVNLMNVGSLAGADGGTRNLCYFGDPGIEYLSVITQKGLDLANRSIVDFAYAGNLETGLSPRFVQALDSTVPGYDAKTVGIASMGIGGIAGGIMGPGLVDRLVCTSGLAVIDSRTTVRNSRLVVEFDPTVNTTLAFTLHDTFNAIDALSVDVAGNLTCRSFTGGAVSVANVPFVSSPLGAAFRAGVYRAFAGQTANVVEFQDSGGGVGLAVDKALRVKSTVQTAPVLSDMADGETVWYRTSGGNVVFVSRVSGALKTATLTVA